MMKFLEQAQKRNLSITLETHKYFCDDTICSTMAGDVPMYFDNNHVSTYGAEKLSHVFDPVMDHINSGNKN